MTWNPTSGSLSDPFAALSGGEVAAIDLTTDITGNFNALQAAIWGAPTSFTPAWTSSGSAPALGNGNAQGSYMRLGHRMLVQEAFSLGTTSTIGSGFYGFSLPVALSASYVTNSPIGSLTFVDASAGVGYTRTLVMLTSTTTAGLDPSGAVFGASSPAVPANGDKFLISLNYITA